MTRQRSVDVHAFSMIPRADIPRSSFRVQTAHKTTFDAGYLIPILCEEVLPGDTITMRMTPFVRMATPVFPVMDNLHLESFFFFCPSRILWNNWEKFMGQQTDPGDSIDYTIPTVVVGSNGYGVATIYDYLGLPTVGQITAGLGNNVTINVLPLRAYNRIWNEWFRDQNLQDSASSPVDDGPDATSLYTLRRRGKRHDYFTSCLPFVQKGDAVQLPLGTTAPVVTGAEQATLTASDGLMWRATDGSSPTTLRSLMNVGGETWNSTTTAAAAGTDPLWPSNLYADLSAATAATINEIRQAFQIQKLLERDARGGTRYTEIVRAHFGVVSPDARLQRPEYLGGGYTPVNIHPVAQTESTDSGTTPLATLAGFGTAAGGKHAFSQSFTEHGYILGLINVRADLNYQQGLRKMWSRRTRYDFYFPVFSHLGEQAVLNQEIYVTGTTAQDEAVFGYQERWAEYRHSPSKITGLFRSTSAGTLDAWHLAQNFTALPTLNDTFIQETPPMDRVLAAGELADDAQFYADFFFDLKMARPLPMFSVPGLVDHF